MCPNQEGTDMPFLLKGIMPDYKEKTYRLSVYLRLPLLRAYSLRYRCAYITQSIPFFVPLKLASSTTLLKRKNLMN